MKYIRNTNFWRWLTTARAESHEMVELDDKFDRFVQEKEDARNVRAAAQRLQVKTRHYFTQEFVLRQHDRANWDGVHPDVKEFALELVKQARRRMIPLYVHTALRTKDEQAKLYAQGRSKISGPKAPHTVGCAVDIVHSEYHWDMTKNEWDYIGELGFEILRRKNLQTSFDWGGNWSFWDPAHWQLSDWSKISGHWQ